MDQSPSRLSLCSPESRSIPQLCPERDLGLEAASTLVGAVPFSRDKDEIRNPYTSRKNRSPLGIDVRVGGCGRKALSNSASLFPENAFRSDHREMTGSF